MGALGSAGSADGKPRELPTTQLEVAVLDRTRGKRKFRRITGAALTALLPSARRRPPRTRSTRTTCRRPDVARLYHVSSTRNRDSIEAHGLDRSRMGAARGIAGSPVPEVEGVFLCRDLDEVQWFSAFGDDAVDVWAVEVDEVDLVTAPEGYFYVPGVVARSAITRVDPPPPLPRTEQGPGSAYRSALTITRADGTVLHGDAAHDYIAGPAPRRQRLGRTAAAARGVGRRQTARRRRTQMARIAPSAATPRPTAATTGPNLVSAWNESPGTEFAFSFFWSSVAAAKVARPAPRRWTRRPGRRCSPTTGPCRAGRPGRTPGATTGDTRMIRPPLPAVSPLIGRPVADFEPSPVNVAVAKQRRRPEGDDLLEGQEGRDRGGSRAERHQRARPRGGHLAAGSPGRHDRRVRGRRGHAGGWRSGLDRVVHLRG